MIMNVESISNAWRGNLSCEDCSIRLNVFRKKKACHFCKKFFCQLCITRREDKKFCCRKCQILTARPLDRNKLLNLKSRDLINYLSSRNIPTNGCVEKEDLVNVLIEAVNNSSFYRSSNAYRETNPSYSSSSRNNIDSTSQLPNRTVQDGIRITGHDSTENEEGRDRVSPMEPDDDVIYIPPTTETQLSEVSISSNLEEEKKEVSTSEGDCSGFNKPLTLSNIKNKSELEALSVKQLKELLMRNRTDFKGCVERAELIQKANRLWSDYTISRKELENLSLEELCKICMDAPIECVLLECGHMATCTSCGKQLCECPICRQFVVRCVRTFKA